MALMQYDGIYKIGFNIYFSLSDVHEAIMSDWDYEKRTNSVRAKICKEIENLDNIKPVGWDELKKDYKDFQGMEEYCEKQQRLDEMDFAGHRFDVIAPSYPSRIACPYVMYDEVCQNRKAYFSLIGSIFAQGLSVAEHNNSIEIAKDLENILEEIKKPEYYKDIVYDIDLSSLVKNKITKTILAFVDSKIKSELTIDENNFYSFLDNKYKNQLENVGKNSLLVEKELVKIRSDLANRIIGKIIEEENSDDLKNKLKNKNTEIMGMLEFFDKKTIPLSNKQK